MGNKDTDTDELSLDFSKITNIFKKKKKSDDKVTEVSSKNTSDDFEKSDEDEISIDTKKIFKFISKNKMYLLILIPLFLSVFFRMYPADLPVTDSWAYSNIYNSIQSDISNQISQQFPNLPEANRNTLIQTNLNKFIEENQGEIDTQAAELSKSFKSRFKNENGYTYLLAIDPYTFYRQTRNMVEKGHHYDEIRNGVPWNTHMLAPIGRQFEKKPSGHVFFQYILYKIMSIFNKNIDIMGAVFYAPIIISMLSVIPAFFIARKFSGDIGATVAGILLAIHPVFLSRTPGGFSDTDAYNVFFPLIVVWFLIEGLSSENLRSRVIFTTLAGFAIGLYSQFWTVWIMFDLMLASVGVYLVYLAITYLLIKKNKLINLIKSKSFRNAAIIILIFLISGPAFTYIFSQQNLLKISISSPYNIVVGFKSSSKADYWPNVYTTVAELNDADYQKIITDIGIGGKTSRLFFAFSVLGILFTLVKRKDEKNIDVKLAIILFLWFIATMYGSTKGIRFILLLVPAFSVSAGIFFGRSYEFLSDWISRSLEVNKYITSLVLLILIAVILIGPVKAANSVAMGEIPSMTDAWYNSLIKIKDNSEPDAIINSWWDFGHWFKAVGDRAVTFDGASQNTPMAHWIGKTLLTDDEELARGILRMLDCSSNNAFDYVNSKVTNGDIDESIHLLYDLVVLDRNAAHDLLDNIYSLPEDEINDVLEKTHCSPPEDFFITSEDMVGKSGVWAHFGSWDFERSQMWINVNGLPFDEGVEYIVNNFDIGEDEAADLYYQIQNLDSGRSSNDWIAPWPGYMSGVSGCSPVAADFFQCGNGLMVNTTTLEAQVGTQEGIKKLSTLGFIDVNNEFVKKVYTGSDVVGVGAILIPQGNTFASLLMDPVLVGSMFTRLFYLEGHGMKYFDKFSDERSVINQRIIVWKVDWQGESKNNFYNFIQDEPVVEPEIDSVTDVKIESPNTTDQIEESEVMVGDVLENQSGLIEDENNSEVNVTIIDNI